MKKRPIQFSFDDRGFESIEKMTKQGRFGMPCTNHGNCFPSPAPTSYKEVIVTNPETNESRVLLVPVYE